MAEEIGVVVVGAGQAGLSTSHELAAVGVEHVVLERGRIGQTWRDRWDSFCLVTPNWTVKLPGGTYDGPDPDGYMHRDEIVAHLERYAASFVAPVREGCQVSALKPAPGGGIKLETSEGDIHAPAVVLSTGAYQKAHRPRATGALPSGLLQIDAEGYSNPEALPRGPVLIIGSGQTGCQLAEELHQSGREVHLACGRTPWVPRRFGDRDSVTWLADTPFFEQRVTELPSPMARLVGNPQNTGHDGGHDLHFRVLQRMGVGLMGHYLGAEEGKAYFADDLAECVAFGDARYDDVRTAITKACAARGVEPPEMPDPPPFVAEAKTSLDLAGFGAVIFTSGFRPDYRSLVAVPQAFDDLGFPVHEEGASTVLDGLYFVGVHYLRKRKSSLLIGVGEDAEIVARQVAAQIAGPAKVGNGRGKRLVPDNL